MKLFFCILFALWCHCCAYAQSDSFTVFFATGKYQADAVQKARLDSFLQTGKLQQAPTIIIMGYGDKAGGDTVNKKISQLRSNEVLRYLVTHGIDKATVISCNGLGIRDPHSQKDTAAADRRVTILLMRVPLDSNISKAMSGLAVGQTLVLRNINFVNGTHRLEPTSYGDLEQLYIIMLLYPSLKIRIEGHICCFFTPPGDDDDRMSYADTSAYNRSTLSVNRAKFICNYLISKGVDSSRLTYMGFGNTRPLINPERNDADRKQNRRVEVRVMDK